MSTETTLDPGTATAIQKALAAAMGGRLSDARRIGETALGAGGNVAALNALLGTFCLRNGEYEAAVRHLNIARAERADDAVIAVNLGTALVQLGSYAEALEAIPEELANRDASLRLLRIRAFCAQSVEDYPPAISAYKRVVTAEPSDWESWNNLGNSLRCIGDLDAAVAALRRAAELAPDAAPVRLNYANALLKAGQASDGEKELRALASDFPDDWHPLRDLHLHLRSQSREEEALEAIEEASKRNPEDLELLLAVASQRLLLVDNRGAEEAYREVVRRDPHNVKGNLGLAVTFELSNRLEDLSAFVTEVEGRGVDVHTVNFIRAFDHRRAKRFLDGLEAMADVPSDVESARHAQLLGQLHDGAGNYDEAFSAFSRMNEIQKDNPSLPEQRAAAFRELVSQKFEATTPAWARKWRTKSFDDGRASPAFLVGFPRSGTTLLDTILMGHSQIEVLEEEPTLHRSAELLADYENLPDAPDELISKARRLYFDEVAKRTPMAPGKLIIDKNPLSMLAVPLIRRILPTAKIILAVRHPCDVVLSCYTTSFKLNEGMSNFLSLDTTAEFYDLCFSYFERAIKLLPVAAHTVVYENVVANREQELRSLIGFLELDWEEQVMDHQKAARERGEIKTASYAQVSEPIYDRSSGRWRHYRKHLKPVLPVLKPWIEKFGFEA